MVRREWPLPLTGSTIRFDRQRAIHFHAPRAHRRSTRLPRRRQIGEPGKQRARVASRARLSDGSNRCSSKKEATAGFGMASLCQARKILSIGFPLANSSTSLSR